MTVANPVCAVNGCEKPAPDTTYCSMTHAENMADMATKGRRRIG